MKNKFKKIKERFNRMNKTKRFLVLAVFSFILLGGLATATYFFSVNQQATYDISGVEGELSVTIPLSDVTWNLSEGLTNNNSLTINNANGDTDMLVSFDVVVNGTDVTCDEVGDIDYKLYQDGTEVLDSEIITISSGLNILWINSTAIDVRSCPRSDTISISLVE